MQNKLPQTWQLKKNTYSLDHSSGFQKTGPFQLGFLLQVLQGQNQGASQEELLSEDSGK